MKKLVVLLYITVAIPLFAQTDTDAESYRLLLSEAQAFQAHQPASASSAALLDSARTYAAQKEFLLANVFLEEYLQTCRRPLPQSSAKTDTPQKKSMRFEISSGVDFNRQEFELGYSSADSLLAEEINKPFLALNLEAGLWKQLSLQTNLRYDKENRTALARLFLNQNTGHSPWYVDGMFSMDQNQLYPEFSYSEWGSKQMLSWELSSFTKIDFWNTFRYKRYKSPSATVPDFFKDETQLQWHVSPSAGGRYRLNYRSDFNHSLNTKHNNYWEQSISAESAVLNRLHSGLNVETGYTNKRYTYLWDDSTVNNRAQTVFVHSDGYYYFNRWLSWKFRYEGETKRYVQKSEQDPDYWLHELNMQLKSELFEGASFSAGYRLEYKKHILSTGLEENYVKDQNYTGNGVIVGGDYFRLNGTLISLEASYTFRRYPTSTGEAWGGLYNDKNVLNVTFIAQIPLLSCINLNLFASYDNDKDLDSDNGNTRSSIFSAELLYTF